MISFRTQLGLLNAGFLFLLLTLLIASKWGSVVGLFAAVTSNLAFNYFFIEPVHTFSVQEPHNVVALIVFLAVSAIGGALLSSARRSAAEAVRRQAEAETVLKLSHAMSTQTEPQAALETLCKEVDKALAMHGAAVLVRQSGAWAVLATDGSTYAGRLPDPSERLLLDRAAARGTIASRGAAGLLGQSRRRIVVPRGREAAYRQPGAVVMVPLHLGGDVRGVMRLDGPMGDSAFRSRPEPLLNAIAAEAALTIEWIELSQQASHVRALEEADSLKTALMTSISHDLKTPLAGIKASITSLLDKRILWPMEDLQSFYQTIDDQADRLNRVISDILDLNRIEDGTLVPEAVPLDARAILQRVREVTAAECKGREVVIETPAAMRIVADEALLTQALVNLIENAARYSTPATPIQMLARNDDDSAVIEVRNEGPAIDPRDLVHLFERYYRAGDSGRRVKGSGLGLTVAKGFIELCNGSIEAESTNEGTVFRIRLPADRTAMVSP